MATDQSAPERTPAEQHGYIQIADDLRLQIQNGELAAGDELPSLSELVQKYGAGQQTARRAISVLQAQGLITSSQGKRPVVRGSRTRVTRSNRQHHLEKERIRLPEEERRVQGPLEDTTGISLHDATLNVTYREVVADESTPEFETGTPLLRREYETTGKRGNRIAWSVSWIPLAFISSNPDLLDSSNEPWPGSTQHQFSTVGIEIAEVVDTITARAPDTVEAARWGMSPGEPLLVGRDLMRDTQDRVVCVSLSQYPADSTQMEFVTPLPKADQ
ncbi:GntR family transcriptional regulator [Promicromonospora sp. NPDC057138]|uniref:GntR family transcriptional regulator n=1 Tax=Promicromonospora sp. NPDC057138 TaxID=3346031 RepID=UPI003627A161